MDIAMEHQSFNSYQKVYSGEKLCKLSADSVIPDTFDDISRLLTAEFSCKIVSKDVSFGKITVCGELTANTLFIPENSNTPESVVSTIPFTADFPAEDIDSSSIAVASIRILAADWRELNPRKVGLNADVTVEVEAYLRSELRVPAMAPDTTEKTYFKSEKTCVKNISLISEKLVNVEDMLDLSDASAVLSSSTEYCFDNYELIGSRLIIKGHAHCRVIYCKTGGGVGSAEYDTAFSQLFDYEGSAPIDDCEVTILPAGEYYDLSDNSLSMELRVVLEVMCYENREVEYVADAYACGCDYELVTDEAEITAGREVTVKNRNIVLSYDLPENYDKVIVCSSNTGKITLSGNNVNVPVIISTISADKDNNIIPFRLRGNAEFEDISCENVSAYIESIICNVSGNTASLEVSVRLRGMCCVWEKISAVSAISVNTEVTKIISPSVYISRAEDSSIWTIAKKYGADKERIAELNAIEENEDIKGRMLLIPKA